MQILGIPLEFVLFAITLLGVALFHHKTLQVALTGVIVITLYKVLLAGFREGPGLHGLLGHFEHEWVLLANLFCLLLSFTFIAEHFERSEFPAWLPRLLPNDWTGPLSLLAIVFVLSSFLDNIAAALIGGAMAHALFHGKVHVGFLAAIVAAANAGGAGSVIGDTTTTMMWISGVSPFEVIKAYIGAFAALITFGIPASVQQQLFSPIIKDPEPGVHVDPVRLAVVIIVLAAVIATNVVVNLQFSSSTEQFPYIGVAAVAALIITIPVRRPNFRLLPTAFKGTIFLLCLVTAASMMPVERLPEASSVTVFGLGFLSAVFDNIPLTALAIEQNGYDWGILAYAVGFGGSMMWFGSSAGVALSNLFPYARSVKAWFRDGWYVILGYIVGFFLLLAFSGWHPSQA